MVGSSGVAGNALRERASRRFAMGGRDVGRDEAECGRQHRRVIGEADDRHHVGHKIERQDEICERGDQRDLDMARSIAVERAEIGGDEIFRERQVAPRRAVTFGQKRRARAARCLAASGRPIRSPIVTTSRCPSGNFDASNVGTAAGKTQAPRLSRPAGPSPRRA